MRAFTPPSDGLTGLLVTNKEGSIHEDSVVDRVLTLCHSGRTLMEVYDPSWPISTNVVTGHTYQVLLVATNCVGLHLPILPFEGVKLGIWRGKILQAPWYAPENGFRVARPSLYRLHGKRRAWVLVATQIGPMLLNSLEVRQAMSFQPKAGDILQWESALQSIRGGLNMYRQIGIRVFIVIDRITQFIYRTSDGRIGEVQGKVHMLLLHSVGRKTGKIRTHCLQYQRNGQNYLIIASNFGLPKSPAWFLNLQANPRIQIQVGRQHLEVVAHTATPEERQRLWPMVTKKHPPYADYQAATIREIPVVILTPVLS